MNALSIKAAADDSAPPSPGGGRKPMSASERARHASLVRWKKEQPFGDRLARIRALRAKRKGKGKAGKKPAKTPEQRLAEREQQKEANRQKVFGELGLMEDAAGALSDLAAGRDTSDDGGLIKMGLAEQGKDGTLRLTPAGRQVFNAASRGDTGAAKDAAGRARDRVAERGERETARAEREKGKGGGKRKPKREAPEKEEVARAAEKEPQEERGPRSPSDKRGPMKPKEAEPDDDATADATAADVGLNKRDLSALRDATDTGGSDNPALRDLGFTDADGDATPEGVDALDALERGDARGYRRAVRRARAHKRRGDRQKQRDEERAAERTKRQTEAESRRRTQQEARNRRTSERDSERSRRERASRDEAVASEVARIDAARSRKGIEGMELQPLLEDLEELRDELTEEAASSDATKAGARNSAADLSRIQAIYDAAEEICEMAEALGADAGGEEEMMEGMEEGDMEGKAQRTFGGKDRGDLDASDFAGPDRTFPIMTAADVRDAARLIGKAENPEAVKRKIIAIARRKGFADAIPESWQAGATKGIEYLDDDLAVLFGDGCKAIGDGDGWVGGYLVKFGGDGDLSQWRDIFGRETDYGRHTKSDVWVHHRMLPGLGKRRLTNQAEIGMDDEGVFIKHLLDLRSSYERKLYGMVQADKLGWSSGTAPHLVERKALEDGKHAILEWPLGLDASYTPMPAGGMGVEARATALKSLFADAGIDLLQAIYDDNPEALDQSDDRPDGAKAAQEHARRLLLRSRLLALQE